MKKLFLLRKIVYWISYSVFILAGLAYLDTGLGHDVQTPQDILLGQAVTISIFIAAVTSYNKLILDAFLLCLFAGITGGMYVTLYFTGTITLVIILPVAGITFVLFCLIRKRLYSENILALL
jgi:hypothetical protein